MKIVSSNAGKDFAAEEISAQVLRKLVDDAGKFLNDKVCYRPGPETLGVLRSFIQFCGPSRSEMIGAA